MCCASSDENLTNPDNLPSFEEIQGTVRSEFDVTESYVQHGVPTFHVNYKDDSKQAFLKLMKSLEAMKLLPILRENNGTYVLQVLAKPPTQPNKNTVNIALFFATLGTVFVSGYLQAADVIGALLFTASIMAILGSHEMGHKLLADKHQVDATYPYFIPGLPPIGTFGALIRQKELPPNKDALFDIGFTGPITGFIIAVIVTIIGIQLSTLAPLEPEASLLPVPLMFQIIVALFPPSGVGEMILLHPVAYAGWVGMIVTM
ncbi:MAG TPA: site-2 protease family protein, partial [Candidatus Bathyarchaeota archaeon]|nr:site-2 protease family protein [Candidatus Bathyarchaeota archaeon]